VTESVAIARPRYSKTSAQEARYHFNMAHLCRERGLPNLARSHSIAAGLFLGEDAREAALAACKVRLEAWERLQADVLARVPETPDVVR